jgi:hypothetical protein
LRGLGSHGLLDGRHRSPEHSPHRLGEHTSRATRSSPVASLCVDLPNPKETQVMQKYNNVAELRHFHGAAPLLTIRRNILNCINFWQAVRK